VDGRFVANQTRITVIGIGVIFAALVAVYVASSRPSTPDYPFGCDEFGYARQQELFRNHGLLGGLDTRVDAPEARFLIETAKQAGLTANQFGEMIAPHCHHHETGTDSVILQYPPGTGFLLSLFPAEREVQVLHVVSLVLLLTVFGVFAVIGLPSVWTPSLVLAGLVPVAMALSNSALMVSASMPPTIGFATLATGILLWCTGRPENATWWGGALIGLVAGFLVDLRVANVFVVVGMATFIVLAMGTLSLRGLAHRLPFLLSGIAAFALAVAPHLAANAINAGAVLESTYGSADSAGPKYEMALLGRNLTYYFFETPAWPIVWAAIVAIVIAGVLALWGPSDNRRRTGAAAIAGALSFGLSVLFFATHEITASSYLIPTSTFTIAVCAFTLAQSAASIRDPAPFARPANGLVVVVIAMLGFAQILQLDRHPYSVTAPPEMLAPISVVWADVTSGTIYFYTGKYAAKVIFAGECEQNRLIRAVADSGRPQYIVVDSDAMQRLVDRLDAAVPLEEAGTLRAREDRKVYRLAPGATVPAC